MDTETAIVGTLIVVLGAVVCAAIAWLLIRRRL